MASGQERDAAGLREPLHTRESLWEGGGRGNEKGQDSPAQSTHKRAQRLERPFKLGWASRGEFGQAWGCCGAAATTSLAPQGLWPELGFSPLPPAAHTKLTTVSGLYILRLYNSNMANTPTSQPFCRNQRNDDHLPQSLSGALRTSSFVVWGHTPGKTSNPPEKLQEKGALSTLPSHPDGLEVHRAIPGLTSLPDPDALPAGSLWDRPGCRTTATLTSD